MTNEKNIPQTCVTICLACLVGGGESFSKNSLIFSYLLWFTEALHVLNLSHCNLSPAHVKSIAVHTRVLFHLSFVIPYKYNSDFIGYLPAFGQHSYLIQLTKVLQIPNFQSEVTLVPLAKAESN